MSQNLSVSLSSSRHWADRLGAWTSALCVVHCLLTPVVLSLSAVVSHFLPAEESVHRGFAVLVALFGVLALVSGFRRHRRRRVLLLMVSGVGLIAATAWWGDRLPTHMAEVAVTLLGSTLMIAAHRLNHTFCKSCSCAEGC